jgi:chemotaxis protein CheC
MNADILSNDQREALQEIANVGMGMAGDSIARLLGEFIKLSCPKVRLLPAHLLGPTLTEIIGNDEVAAVRQAFHGDLRGESMVLFNGDGRHEMAALMGYDILDPAAEHELLLDVGNMVANACVRGIAGQLDADIGFSPPRLVTDCSTASALFEPERITGQCALFVEVNFRPEQRSFACHLVILLPESEVAVVCASLDRLLAQL